MDAISKCNGLQDSSSIVEIVQKITIDDWACGLQEMQPSQLTLAQISQKTANGHVLANNCLEKQNKDREPPAVAVTFDAGLT